MPWYYAGPEAKPVGPVSVEELHARFLSGAVKPETYVIEHTGQPVENWTWKRYREVFPTTLPPVPPIPTPTVLPPPPVPQPAAAATPHPLFPSAAPVSGQPPVFTGGTRPDPYYAVKPTNAWCAWGFGLGFVGFIFSFACGIGVLLAAPSLLLCAVGLAQVQRNRGQAGQGMAIAGLLLSSVALIISLAFIVYLALPYIKAHEQTATEQTTNDSD